MNRPASTIPLIVNRRGEKRIIEVRRQSNDEIMQNSLNTRGVIQMRVVLQIKNGKGGTYLGYQGASSYRAVKNIKEAREFEKKLRQFVEG